MFLTATGDYTLTCSNGLSTGTAQLNVFNSTLTKTTTLALGSGSALVCGNFVQGTTTAQDRSGVLSLGSGTANISGDISVGNDANLNNAIDLGTGVLNLGGTMEGNADGTNPIAVTNSGGYIVGGTVNNTTADTETFHFYPAAAGTGNTLITEVNLPSRSSGGTRGRNSYRGSYRGAYRRAS